MITTTIQQVAHRTFVFTATLGLLLGTQVGAIFGDVSEPLPLLVAIGVYIVLLVVATVLMIARGWTTTRSCHPEPGSDRAPPHRRQV